ncbi:S-layer protein domain-containing protein [Methanolobus sp. ZRKC3]|uniref:S-layer protein domain-containing protein n=1 Tax=Methanolobus sp. ZRKC3 TaxID=3125786 RepID=UPI003245145B
MRIKQSMTIYFGIAFIFLIIAAGTVAAETITVDGPVYNGTDLNDIVGLDNSDFIEMNASNFAGFIPGETLKIYGGNFVSDRTINEGGLVYKTQIEQVEYESSAWDSETYPLIALFKDIYVPISDSDAGELARLLVDSGENYTLEVGETLDLGNGYELTLLQIDVIGDKVWLEFTKDGTLIDDEVIDTSAGPATWILDLDIAGENDVEVFRVNIAEISQAESSILINGLWLIDFQKVLEVETSDEFGILEVDSVTNSLYMVNYDESVYLRSGSIQEIAEGMKFKVTDDTENLTFYLSRCVEPIYPIADFTVNTTSGIAPLTVQFTDLSTNADSWEWDVDGDNIVDYTTKNPVHTYTSTGSYNITLTIGNMYESDTETKVDYIKVIDSGIILQPDWNLISFPENLDESSIDHILQDFNKNEVDMVFYDDAYSGLMLVPTEFEALKGYWVHNNMSGNVVIDELYLEPKVPSRPPSLTLYPGFNAIGHTAKIELPAEYALSTIDDSYTEIYGPWISSEGEFAFVGYNSEKVILGDNQISTDSFNMSMYNGYYVVVEKECVLA